MRRRIAKRDRPVMPRADNLPVRDCHCADRDFTFRLGATGFGNSLGHELQVFGGGHR